ncbi:MAG: DUF3501 family protein [Rhodospirillales bacterium]|nr:DUF3501 family protein [Rhodospirillales bacterium]
MTIQPRRALTRADIMDMADFARVRKERRAAIAALKRHRRLAVGPFATFHFECFETMWMQVHEMLHIERGGEEQIAGELEAYNPLIPRGDALIATLMLEIDDPPRRERELYRLAGIEDTVRLDVGDSSIAAQPIEDEIARTTDDGKTSSIHFLRFPFSPAEAAAFRTPGARVLLGIGHPAYGHLAIVPEQTRAALAEDLDDDAG